MCYGTFGVVGSFKELLTENWNNLESLTIESDSLVQVICQYEETYLSRAGHAKSCLNPRGPSRKAKYSQKTDSEPVL